MRPLLLKNKNMKFILISLVAIGGLILAISLILRESALPTKFQDESSLRRQTAEANIPLKVSRNNPETNILRNEDKGLSNSGMLFSRNNVVQSAAGIVPANTGGVPDAERSLLRLKDYMKSIEERNIFLKENFELLSKLLESKEKEILQLREEKARLEENLIKTIESQRQSRNELDASLNNLTAQLNQKDSEIANLNAIKLNLENQINDLNSKLTALSNVQTSLENQLAKVSQEKSSLEIEFNKLKEDLQKQKELNDVLSKNISEFTANLNDKEKRLAQLQASKDEIDSELNKLKVIKTENENQINQLDSRLNELGTLHEEAKNSIFQITNLLTKKDSELGDKQSQMLKLKENFDGTNREKEGLHLSLEEKEKIIRDLNAKLINMESQMQTLQRELVSYEERQAETTEQLNQLKSLNNSLKKRLKNIYMELELLRIEKKSKKKEGSNLYRRKSAVVSSLDEIENRTE